MTYRFRVTCPTCAGPLEHVTNSNPTELGTRVTAIASCATPRCVPWQIVVEMIPVGGRPVRLPA